MVTQHVTASRPCCIVHVPEMHIQHRDRAYDKTDEAETYTRSVHQSRSPTIGQTSQIGWGMPGCTPMGPHRTRSQQSPPTSAGTASPYPCVQVIAIVLHLLFTILFVHNSSCFTSLFVLQSGEVPLLSPASMLLRYCHSLWLACCLLNCGCVYELTLHRVYYNITWCLSRVGDTIFNQC